MSIEVVTPKGVHPATGYSHAVKMGGLVFVAGQVALDREGNVVGRGDIAAQVKQVFANLAAVLEESGSGLDLVGKITVFTTNLGFRPAISEARNAAFAPFGQAPASTFLVVSSLATPDMLVEIEAVAALR